MYHSIKLLSIFWKNKVKSKEKYEDWIVEPNLRTCELKKKCKNVLNSWNLIETYFVGVTNGTSIVVVVVGVCP